MTQHVTSDTHSRLDLEPRPTQLAHLTPTTLDRTWRAAPAVQVSDVQGDLRVRFIYLRGEEHLPTRFRRVLKAMLFSRFFPLRTKRTEGSRGINRFGFGMGQLGFMRFEVRPDTAWDGDKDVLVLDYDVADNPFWLRPIRDEICRIDPGFFLGRMGWRTQSNTWLGLYFTLRRPIR